MKKVTLIIFCFCFISVYCLSQEILSFEKQTELRKLSFSEDSLFTSEQLKEDFIYFYETILATHPNPYHAISKDSFDAKVADIMKSLDKPMNRREFWLKIATFNSCFDAHTNIAIIKETISVVFDNSKAILPFGLLMLDSSDNLYFNSKYKNSLLAGKYIKSINNIHAKQMIDNISSYYSHENKNILSKIFFSHFSLFYSNIYGNLDSLRFEYFSNDNEIDAYTFYPRKTSTDTITTTQITQQSKKGLCLSLYEKESIAIIEINSCYHEILGEHYHEDLEKMMSDITENNIQHLFIDISRNGGGYSSSIEEILNFIKTEKKKYYTAFSEIRMSPVSCENSFNCKNFSDCLKKHKKQLYETSDGMIMIKQNWFWKKKKTNVQYNQNLYLIQSELTASAAVDLASIVKAYKFATIIGQETGGLTGCYISSPSFAMPNTLITFSCSVQKSINVGGAMDGRGVLPDIEYEIENPYKSFTLEQLKEMLQLVEKQKGKQ